jgi:hypothetical protein
MAARVRPDHLRRPRARDGALELPEDAPLSEEWNICVDRAFVGLRKHAPVYTVAIVLTLFGIFAVLLHLV